MLGLSLNVHTLPSGETSQDSASAPSSLKVLGLSWVRPSCIMMRSFSSSPPDLAGLQSMPLRPPIAATRVVLSAADALAAGKNVQATTKLAPTHQRAIPPAA